MYRKDATRLRAECAETAVCADDAKGAVDTAYSAPTWISPATPSAESLAAPANELLVEIDGRIDALAEQLARLVDLRHGAAAIEDSTLDYLLEQFRILTFTVSGTMSRQIMTDPRRIPVGQLRSIQEKFLDVADALTGIVRRVALRDPCLDEIQRQSRSVSQKLAMVIDRLCGSQAGDFLDEMEVTLLELTSLANKQRDACQEEIGQLGQRLNEILAQFEDAVEQTNQYAAFSERFQRITEIGNRALDRLLHGPSESRDESILRLHVRFGFAVTQFAIRCNNAAMPQHAVS